MDARAEERESRAFTSMILYSSEAGSRAYWMLHSPTMPMLRMTWRATVRKRWYSLSVRVWEGATTMLSPVWMPRGSKFSMLQTVMQLSNLSRTTSYSTSFHPPSHSSTRTWGEREKAFSQRVTSCFSLLQSPEPAPPRAKAALTITG